MVEQVRWGQHSVAEAERRLFIAALHDRANVQMVLLSESCMFLYPPAVVFLEALSERRSRINACAWPVVGDYIRRNVQRCRCPLPPPAVGRGVVPRCLARITSAAAPLGEVWCSREGCPCVTQPAASGRRAGCCEGGAGCTGTCTPTGSPRAPGERAPSGRC